MRRKKVSSVLKCFVSTVMVMAIVVAGIPANTLVESQAASSYVAVTKFSNMIKSATGQVGWAKTDPFYQSTDELTYEQAAVMLERADKKINGKNYDNNLYSAVVKYKRIKDISKAEKDYRKSLRMCFVKGIMPGTSPGTYSQKRNLNPKNKVSVSAAKTLVNRLKKKTQRIKLTSDGQVTRTTNLPKNANKYPYILASFPNSYYEPSFTYQRATWHDGYTPVNLKDYASPKDIGKAAPYGDKFSVTYKNFGDQWMDNLRENLKLRLNYSYKMSDKEFEQWRTALLKTFPEEKKKLYYGYLGSFHKMSVAEHTSVQASKIVVEPSGMYMDTASLYVRCYARIKVTGDVYYSADSFDQNIYIFGESVYIPNLKLNQWCDVVMDIRLGSYGFGDNGAHVGLSGSNLGSAGY